MDARTRLRVAKLCAHASCGHICQHKSTDEQAIVVHQFTKQVTCERVWGSRNKFIAKVTFVVAPRNVKWYFGETGSSRREAYARLRVKYDSWLQMNNYALTKVPTIEQLTGRT